jgi:hypothetical protein
LVLLVVLVVVGLMVLDEQRYRSCVAEGGLPEGQERSIDRMMDETLGKVPDKECHRVSPF